MTDPDPHPPVKKIFLLLFVLLAIPAVVFGQAESTPSPLNYSGNWTELPVLPTLSENALTVLRAGIAAGHNPHAFSKVGDCDTSTEWYLSDFDKDTRYYDLGEYAAAFEPVIAFYKGSFSHRSQAAKPGFSAASVLSTYWTDVENCQLGELPLNCEYRLQNPLFVLISMGTNDGYNPPVFKENLRAIIVATLAENRLPILMTKADNVEGNYSINQDISDLAAEYQLPLWNFWASIQHLPDRGLVEDGIHLTFYKNTFSDHYAFNYAWTYRNLTALQLLERMMQATNLILNN
jgi:hypothetical protein